MKSRYVGSLINETDRRFPADTMDVMSWFKFWNHEQPLLQKGAEKLKKPDSSRSVSAEEAWTEFAVLKQAMVSSGSYASFPFNSLQRLCCTDIVMH